ncbi:MAG: efflux RND transporter permease subunit [Candidatus Delongbacteria bacterium]|nr:efflux RND transporter permease subunit [Candidatus Delongbacteria bacterium]
MLNKIIEFCLQHRKTILFMALLGVGMGIWSIRRLPIEALPDVTNVQIEIVSTSNGFSPLEIEQFVTYPIEMEMKGLPGLEQLRSVNKYGISVVTLVFTDRTDIYFAREQTAQRLNEIREKLPEGVEVEMGPIATALGDIYQYTLEGQMPADSAEAVQYLTELRSLQDWVVAPMLKGIPGISEINSFGGYVKQYQIILRPESLIKYRLTASEIGELIDRNNRNRGGYLDISPEQQGIIRCIGLIRSIDDMRRIVVKNQSGIPVYLEDIADFQTGQALRQGAALKNGGIEAVGGIIMMLKGENGLELEKAIARKVEEINRNRILPEGIRIVPYYRQSPLIQSSIRTVLKSLAEGSILVLLVLMFFLRNLRGSIVILISLPLSILGAMIGLKLAGIHANLMSLGGLAISIGMIVDATIIQVENVQRHLSESRDQLPFRDLVRMAVMEVRRPSIFGELIIALVFIPILALQGLEGKMFSPLALTVSIALLSSLIISVFVSPVLCSLVLRHRIEKANPWMDRLQNGYSSILSLALRYRKTVLGGALILLISAIFLIPRLGREFLPIMDEGAFDMDIQILPGVSLDKAMDINRQIQRKLQTFPELVSVVSKTGQTGIALEARSADKTGYVGTLKPHSQWQTAKTRRELFAAMRDSISTIPGFLFGFSQPIQCRIDELVAGTRAQLMIKVFGTDPDSLSRLANQIARELSSLQGTTDLMVEKNQGLPYLVVDLNREALGRYGLTAQEVMEFIQVAFDGAVITRIYEQNRFFDCILRFPESYRQSIQQVRQLSFQSQDGRTIDLAALADIRMEEGPVQISRENGMRFVGIELNITGRDLVGYVEQARDTIQGKMILPEGYFLEWGGQFENQARAMTRLMIIAPMVIGLIILLLIITFRAVKPALLVLFNLPFALIGGVWSLYLAGQYLSVPASIGFIVLFGVAVLNGMVLVSHIMELKSKGCEMNDAVTRSCRVRLRPVLMTAMTTIFNLIPMIAAVGPGSEIQRPLALVVAGGLISATLLTLIILPVLFTLFYKDVPICR